MLGRTNVHCLCMIPQFMPFSLFLISIIIIIIIIIISIFISII